MSSVLTKMLLGEIPCEKIFENDRFAAVLEPAPLAEGHTFVFPKHEVESWQHLGPRELTELLTLAQKLAAAIQEAFPCTRVALVTYGVKTSHAHFHLIPVSGTPGEIDLTRTRPAASAEHLRKNAAKIRAAL